MNNEPVAYAMFRDGEYYDAIHPDEQSKTVGEYDIPLYTHPAKEHDLGISHAIGFDDGFKAGMQRAVEMNIVKTLTDEEIENIAYKVFEVSDGKAALFNFARAILRKAQEI